MTNTDSTTLRNVWLANAARYRTLAAHMRQLADGTDPLMDELVSIEASTFDAMAVECEETAEVEQ